MKTYKRSASERNSDHLDEVDTESGGCNVQQKRHHLKDTVGPDGKTAGNDAHQNRTHGEEDDNRERGQNAMDSAVVDCILKADAEEARKAVSVTTTSDAAVAVTAVSTAIKGAIATEGAVVLLEIDWAVCVCGDNYSGGGS